MLKDFINKYTNPPNQYLLFPGQDKSLRGQCVQLDMLWAQVLGKLLPIYATAAEYWTAIPGYIQIPVGQQQPGDLNVYRGHDAFPEGHMNVQAFNGQVFEQNADPDGSPAHLATRATTYLLGSLRLEGENMNEQQATTLSIAIRKLQGYSEAEIGYFGKSDIPYIMASLDQAVQLAHDASNSTEWNNLNNDAVAHRNATPLQPGKEYRT